MARPNRSVTTVHAQHQVISSYSGPLPPAKEMQALSQINPEFPERLIRMAEKEQEFRHVYNASLAIRAQYLTALLVLAGLACSVIIAFSGSMLASAVIAVSTIVTAAGASLWGRKSL